MSQQESTQGTGTNGAPNTIVADYGRFLAALMKKDLGNPVGIEFIAVGSGSNDETEFKDKVTQFFNENLNTGSHEPKWGTDNQWWVWAKEITGENIVYLDENDVEIEDDTITNKLKITVTTEEEEPCEETLDFREFALLGIAKEEGDPGDPPQFVTDKMYLINYVSHGLITKDKTMKHTRTIKLTFPINNNEEENNE